MKKLSEFRHNVFRLATVVVCLLLLTAFSFSQRRSNERVPAGPGGMIKESSLDYQLWEGFLLVRKANAGEPAAQHELGVRYLQGKGFEADTAKAAFWFEKAAEQGFDLANYNLGILAMNGWGMPWNPFVSYRYFMEATKKDMPEAEFVVALILTEDLVVPQDWSTAYGFMKKAAAKGFEPAKKALVEFKRRGVSDSTLTANSFSDSTAQPIFLDFNVDTATQIDERTLLNELAREAGPELKKSLGVTEGHETGVIRDTTAVALIERAADAGSPEALALLGRLYEKGIGFRRDQILASAYYLRAMRLESGRARKLLWDLVQEPGYIEHLEKLSKEHNPRAQFVWAGLVAARFDQRLSGEQAFALLRSASNQNLADAIIEMGLCYQSGRWTTRDRSKSRELWRLASGLGSREAAIRLAALNLFGNDTSTNLGRIVNLLESEAGEGSILAQVALAYCFETGKGVAESKGEAAKMYRNAAQRGSNSAYDALRRMHDAIRPAEKEFQMTD